MWDENISLESGNTGHCVNGIFSMWILEKRFDCDWKVYIHLKYLQENMRLFWDAPRMKQTKDSGALKSLALCQQLKE